MERTGKTWAIGVIPDDKLVQKTKPIINMLAYLFPFSNFNMLKISVKIGKITKYNTVGDMKQPIIITAAKNISAKRHGDLRAYLLVTNPRAIFFT